MKFVKLDNFWYEYDGSSPVNDATIYSPFLGRLTDEDLTGCQIIEINSAEELDWKGTFIYDEQYLCGWLSPKGIFFGCEYENHSLQAIVLHKANEYELEQMGFIKIRYEDKKCQRLIADVAINKQTHEWNNITLEQYHFLKSYPINNFESIEYRYRKQLHDKAEYNL